MASLRDTFHAASDRAVASAACFGAAFALWAGSGHLLMLSSRVAASSLPAACAATLLGLAFVTGTGQLACDRRCAATCCALCLGATVAFALVPVPALRAVCFCLVAASTSTLVVCDVARLGTLGKRMAVIALAAGSVVGMGALLAIAGIGVLAGLRANVSNYTLYCMGANVTVMAAWAAAFHVQGAVAATESDVNLGEAPTDAAEVHGDAGNAQNEPEKPARVIADLRKALSPAARRRKRNASNSLAPKQPDGFDAATLAVFATVCVTGMGAAFFDGFTFNPYVRDVIDMDLARFAIVAAGAFGILVTAASCEEDGTHRIAMPTATVSLCLGVAGIVALSVGGLAAETAGTIVVAAAHNLLALSGMVLVIVADDISDRRRATLMACALLACGEPAGMAIGVWAKQAVGFSMATVTPIVIAAIALLAVISLAANAHAASSMRDMRVTHAHDLTRREKDLAQERRRKALARAVGDVSLSNREQEAALLAMMGITNKEIAARMEITEKTVAFHLGNFYRKTPIQSKGELVKIGYEVEAEE